MYDNFTCIYIYKIIRLIIDQPQWVSGTTFWGGPRTVTKFTKWSVSPKRLRTAALM